MSQRRAKAAVINIDANCTRIGEAVATAMETMTAVDSDYKKIKAAMLWWSYFTSVNTESNNANKTSTHM